MSMHFALNEEFGQALPAENEEIVDCSGMAAALLLGRVEAMVRSGNAGAAVDHVVTRTGVERTIVEEFVGELEAQIASMGVPEEDAPLPGMFAS